MTTINVARRRLLTTSGSVLGLASVGAISGLSPAAKALAATQGDKGNGPSLPAYADWKDAESLIIHSANTMETKRTAFGSGIITPLDRLFVRNNIAPPSEDIIKDPDAWTLEIDGVKNPQTLSVEELKKLGVTTVAMVLQCSGNGRAYFPSNPSGTQWTVGAAGCVIFTGVPVKTLLEHVNGMDENAKYMTGTGGEPIPEGLDPNTIQVERSMPLEAIDNALLAWEINGKPIPLAHGGPLRLVVPGYTGVNNIKYIKRLAFTVEQSAANIQQSGYRLAPMGEKGAPTHESVWTMPVKSWITYPGDPDEKLKAGKIQIQGLAMGGTTDVTDIEVSTDGGESWQKAEFIGPDLGPYAWRQFILSVELEPGTYKLASRATNKNGDTQPAERMENNRGYLNNSWVDHSIELTFI
ncbi:MAG: sulfite oxidase [Alcaligenaceae bacterium]|nr:sulfite oxidase [Alcaligenaceae bacterium]